MSGKKGRVTKSTYNDLIKSFSQIRITKNQKWNIMVRKCYENQESGSDGIFKESSIHIKLSRKLEEWKKDMQRTNYVTPRENMKTRK